MSNYKGGLSINKITSSSLRLMLWQRTILTDMPPRVKRPRAGGDGELTNLQRLLHTGGISVKGLSELLQRLGGDPVSRWTLSQENNKLFTALRCCEEIPLASGGNWEWEYLDPNRLLQARVEQVPSAAALFTEAARRRPPSLEQPWSLVIG